MGIISRPQSLRPPPKIAESWNPYLMLLILGGLPAVGKTSIATGLARDIKAVHMRIDSIEQALRNSQVTVSGPEGYIGRLCDC